MATLTIPLDDELHVALTQLAERTHGTKSDLIRDMLRREAARAESRCVNAFRMAKAAGAAMLAARQSHLRMNE